MQARATTDTSKLEEFLKAKIAAVKPKALRELGVAAKKVYDEDVQGTWKHKYPVTVEVSALGGYVEVSINGDIPSYLNFGTAVRHAVMSDDFIAKTVPNFIPSGAGAGRKLFVSKRVRLPGIEARNFDQSVADKVADQAADIITAAWNSI